MHLVRARERRERETRPVVRSSRAEPFGERFLRRAIARLLAGDVAGVREAFLETADALVRRALPSFDVSSRVRLTKTPEDVWLAPPPVTM